MAGNVDGFYTTLPDLNEVVGIGIAAAADGSLVEAKKLPIYVDVAKSVEFNATMTAVPVYESTTIGHNGNADKRRFLATAAYAVVCCGLTEGVTFDPAPTPPVGPSITDGDAYLSTAAATVATPAGFNIIQNDIGPVLTMIFSTKIHWFMTNHHTRTGSMSGYALKVYNTVIKPKFGDYDASEFVGLVHKVGHWAPTGVILILLGFHGISVNPRSFTPSATFSVNLFEDMILRITASPSGTHKHTILIAGMKFFAKHKLFMLAPNVPEIMNEIEAFKTLFDANDSARSHIGSQYLTGKARLNINDANAEIGLGLVFLRRLFPKHTLCRSPSLTEEKVTSLPMLFSGF